MEDRPKDTKLIFAEALPMSSEERKAYLDQVCGADTELRQHVEVLLNAYVQAGDDFLAVSPLDAEIALDGEPAEGPGTVIGPYKLLEKIGEGGMAVVYMAQQEHPVQRRVALKIIKLGMDTKQIIARFEAERQALALMDHPNIAKVFDAGSTDTGRPYFVMELVHGISINAFCDQEKLPMSERLSLFMEVCNAVQHAHQRGIIHRDLKPSNIMVTMDDDRPLPKVIDFGIAKATNQRLTEKTVFTRYAQIIGTPTYMSPEQAQMSDLDIDTRSDIYSLGVLLYELLTGTTPFSEEELRNAGYVEMMRIIQEQEPVKPSTRLTKIQSTSSVQIKNQKLKIKNDLDWIVMKSLEKKRTRRYETASAFKRDIQRYLDHEPIHARRPSAVYRLQKYLYRHRVHVLVGAAALVLLGAMIDKGLATYKAQRERDGRILSQVHESLSKGEREMALTQVKRILKSKQVGPEARLLHASMRVDGADPGNGKTELEGLLNEKPEIAGAAYALLARIESFAAGESEAMVEYRKKAHELLLPENAEAYFLRALIAAAIKDKLDLLDQALDLDPQHYDACRLRALTYLASRKYLDLKEEARVMIALRPGDPLGYILRANAMAKRGESEKALHLYDQAIERVTSDSQHVDIVMQQCEVLLNMGQYRRVIARAQTCLNQAQTRLNQTSAYTYEEKILLYAYIICAHTALGEYEEGRTLYERVIASTPTIYGQFDPRGKLENWFTRHVFQCLQQDRPWHADGPAPKGGPYQTMQETEASYGHLADRAKPLLEGFAPSWSPDGSKLAFSLGVRGYSGIAVYDLVSQETELLAVPGTTPAWSPDGQYVAFVRQGKGLRLSTLISIENRHGWYSRAGGDIWLIRADGTDLRYLCHGSRLSWSRDSQRVFFHSDADNMLRAIAIADGKVQAQAVLAHSDWGVPLSVSPNNQHVACVTQDSLNIVDLTVPSSTHTWPGLRAFSEGSWSPTGRQFSLGGAGNSEAMHGLWIFDLNTNRAAQVLRSPIASAAWAPDGTTMAISLGLRYNEIWLADLDPNGSALAALGPAQNLADALQKQVNDCTRRIEADPADANNYLMRAQCHHALQDQERFLMDMETYVKHIHPSIETDPSERKFLDFLKAIWRNQPENVGAAINTSEHDCFTSVSADGLELYFQIEDDIWVVTRKTKDEAWEKPTSIETINSPAYDGSVCLSGDGLSLYFDSERSGGYGSSDLWVTRRESLNDQWGEPENLGPPVNSTCDESWVTVSSDGLHMVFGEFEPLRPAGYGGRDLWGSTRLTASDPWGPPQNLGSTINSSDQEEMPMLSADGLMLFFASNRTPGFGMRDVWLTWRTTTSDPWKTPVNLGPTVNTTSLDHAATLAPDCSILYFTSGRPGGLEGLDIWQIPIDPALYPFRPDGSQGTTDD